MEKKTFSIYIYLLTYSAVFWYYPCNIVGETLKTA